MNTEIPDECPFRPTESGCAITLAFIREHQITLRWSDFQRRWYAVWPHRAAGEGATIEEAVFNAATHMAEYERAREDAAAAEEALERCTPPGHLNPEYSRLFAEKFAAGDRYAATARRLSGMLPDWAKA